MWTRHKSQRERRNYNTFFEILSRNTSSTCIKSYASIRRIFSWKTFTHASCSHRVCKADTLRTCSTVNISARVSYRSLPSARRPWNRCMHGSTSVTMSSAALISSSRSPKVRPGGCPGAALCGAATSGASETLHRLDVHFRNLLFPSIINYLHQIPHSPIHSLSYLQACLFNSQSVPAYVFFIKFAHYDFAYLVKYHYVRLCVVDHHIRSGKWD